VIYVTAGRGFFLRIALPFLQGTNYVSLREDLTHNSHVIQASVGVRKPTSSMNLSYLELRIKCASSHYAHIMCALLFFNSYHFLNLSSLSYVYIIPRGSDICKSKTDIRDTFLCDLRHTSPSRAKMMAPEGATFY